MFEQIKKDVREMLNLKNQVTIQIKKHLTRLF